MSDQDRPAPQHLPYSEIEAGLDPAARAELAALRAQVEHPTPDAARIRGHVDALRDTEARIANWWDSPETQRWIMTITDAGL